MKTTMLGLLAETPIHPGAGRSLGVVDLPVARESVTDYPVLVGSSFKGALRDKGRQSGLDQTRLNRLFGEPALQAGDLLVSDARLLLLPVRSLNGAYRWVTCPYIIERYRRDLRRAGLGPVPDVPKVQEGEALADGSGHLFLEERQFAVAGQPDDALVESIKPLVAHPETRERLAEQLAVLHDDDFSWFVRYGLSIQARNKLALETKQSESLWYEETLPPDTVMYALILGRKAEALGDLAGLFPQHDPYLQAGGNETVGQGWFAVAVRAGEAGEAR